VNHHILTTELTEMKPVGRSLMPEGLLEGLSDQALQDLFAYLRQSQPIAK
jgi:cytochrome c553